MLAMFLTQDFESSRLDLSETSLAHVIIAFTFAGIVGILMLNILIAVISNIFSSVQKQGEKEFWLNRLDFISQIELFYHILSTPTEDNNGSIRIQESLKTVR